MARATFSQFQSFPCSLRINKIRTKFRAAVSRMVAGVARDDRRGFHALEGLGLRGFHALEEFGSWPMARAGFLQFRSFSFLRQQISISTTNCKRRSKITRRRLPNGTRRNTGRAAAKTRCLHINGLRAKLGGSEVSMLSKNSAPHPWPEQEFEDV